MEVGCAGLFRRLRIDGILVQVFGKILSFKLNIFLEEIKAAR
jgi:hypothetical protein